jgi:hypothetical protein
LISHLHGHRTCADAFKDLFRETFRHHAARRRVEHKRGCVRRGQTVIEPVQPEIGDGWHVNKNFSHHYEENGEDQQLSGKADARLPRWARIRVNHISIWFSRRFQNRLSQRFVTSQ